MSLDGRFLYFCGYCLYFCALGWDTEPVPAVTVKTETQETKVVETPVHLPKETRGDAVSVVMSPKDAGRHGDAVKATVLPPKPTLLVKPPSDAVSPRASASKTVEQKEPKIEEKTKVKVEEKIDLSYLGEISLTVSPKTEALPLPERETLVENIKTHFSESFFGFDGLPGGVLFDESKTLSNIDALKRHDKKYVRARLQCTGTICFEGFCTCVCA